MAGVLEYALTLDTSQMDAALRNSSAAVTITAAVSVRSAQGIQKSFNSVGTAATQAGAQSTKAMASVTSGARAAASSVGSLATRLGNAGATIANIVAGAKAIGETWKAASRFFATGGVEGVLTKIRQSVANVRAGLRTIASDPAMRRLAVGAAAAATATLGIMAGIRVVRGGLSTLGTAARGVFNGISSGARGASNALSSVASKATSMFNPLVALLAPAAAIGVAFKASSKAADFESMQVGFTTVLGSAKAARDMIQEITDTAAATPYGIAELAQSARSLLAVTKREEITPTLRMIGDLASAAQKPITELASMYAKIKGSDSVQGEDLNQLSDALPGSLQEFVKVLKVDSVAAVRKLGEEGRITGAALEQVFINLTSKGGMAFEAMAAQSVTTKGLLSTLKDGMDQLLVTFGTPINDFLKPIFTGNIELLDKLNIRTKAFFSLLTAARAQGNLGELIGASLHLGIINAVNALSSGVRSVVSYLGASLPVIFRAAVDELTNPRSQIFFETLFRGIGDMLRGSLEAGASAFASALPLRGTAAAELGAASKGSFTRGENYLTTAKAALATGDLGESIENLTTALVRADEAGKAAAAAASNNPLIDPTAAREAFEKLGKSLDPDAIAKLMAPWSEALKEAPKAIPALKSKFTGLAPLPEKTKPEKESGDGGSDAQVSAGEDARFRGIRNQRESALNRLARRASGERNGRTLGNTDRLAIANADRSAFSRARPLNPERAAAELARANAGTDPGKSRREERQEAKQNKADPLLKEVRSINQKFENLATE